MAKKAKVKAPLTNEDRFNECLKRGAIIDTVEHIHEFGEPTRTYALGEQVVRGNLKDCFVASVEEEGYHYVIGYSPTASRDFTPEGGEIHYQYVAWWDILPVLESPLKAPYQGAKHRLSFSNAGVDSLIFKVLHFGVDFSPEFQRGYVWTQEDKDNFLDSVFKGQDVGKWVFWKRPFPHHQVVVDGKQRLSTLVDFYLGKIKWRGIEYGQLDERSRHIFRDCPVQWAELREGVEYKDVLEIFLDMNICGVPQSPEHLEHVRKLYEEMNND